MAKKPNKKQIKTIAIIIVAIIVIYVIYQHFFNKPTTNQPTGIAFDPTQTPATSGTVLKRGDRNNQVKELQALWNKYAWHFPLLPLKEDGIFGPKTESALVQTIGKKTVSLNEFRNLVNVDPNSSLSIAQGSFGSIQGNIGII